MDPPLPFGIGRRPVAQRVLLLFRTQPDVVALLLRGEGASAQPRLWQDQGLIVVAYTFLTRGERRWLAGSHHLVYHVPTLQKENGAPGDHIWRRECSAWFGSRRATCLRRRPHIRSRFELTDSPTGLRLAVERSNSPALDFHAHRANGWRPGLFQTRHELLEFLAPDSALSEKAHPKLGPRAVADELLDTRLALESLEVAVCEGVLPTEQASVAELTCAVRLRPLITARATQSSRAKRGEQPSAAPAV